MKIFVTGGAGFIGSAVVRSAILLGHEVLNVDKLTYAGDPATFDLVKDHPKHRFVQADIVDRDSMKQLIDGFKPDWVLHLAAETHVDRSIEHPEQFVMTNVVGTSTLLDLAHSYWLERPSDARDNFRFVTVSTDEVFGSLGQDGFFEESSPYDPSSPYSASKAASDQLSLAWYRTYGFPVMVTNCSNNFGPYQHPEKLIPTVIRTALNGESIPIYGQGTNIRDWLYVDDHVSAILAVAENGLPGERYCVGARCEKTNLEITADICEILDNRSALKNGKSYSEQIKLVEDRPGHDLRYAINSSKVETNCLWKPAYDYKTALQTTVDWFVNNIQWYEKAEGRLGLGRHHGKS